MERVNDPPGMRFELCTPVWVILKLRFFVVLRKLDQNFVFDLLTRLWIENEQKLQLCKVLVDCQRVCLNFLFFRIHDWALIVLDQKIPFWVFANFGFHQQHFMVKFLLKLNFLFLTDVFVQISTTVNSHTSLQIVEIVILEFPGLIFKLICNFWFLFIWVGRGWRTVKHAVEHHEIGFWDFAFIFGCELFGDFILEILRIATVKIDLAGLWSLLHGLKTIYGNIIIFISLQFFASKIAFASFLT